MASGAGAIDKAAVEAEVTSDEADAAGKQAKLLTEKLRSRFTIFLRQSEIGDRRRHDRLPVDMDVTVTAGGRALRTKTRDLSEGGMLLAAGEIDALSAGSTATARLSGLGEITIRLAGRSSLGAHCEFVRPTAEFSAAVTARLAALREADRTRIDHVIEAAAEVSRAFDAAVAARRLSREDLFDNDYVPIPGTNPVQFSTRYLKVLEDILPPIQEKWLAVDKQMAFCAAVDRNAYLPVHNRVYSHPQRPDDPSGTPPIAATGASSTIGRPLRRAQCTSLSRPVLRARHGQRRDGLHEGDRRPDPGFRPALGRPAHGLQAVNPARR